MALFEDILNKAHTPPKPSDDKENVEQQIVAEYERLMKDADYLHRRFHWIDLTDKQRQFYIEHVIMPQAQENVLTPIRLANEEKQRIQAQKDKDAYLVKMSGDKSVLLYIDGKRKQFVDTMKVKCPDCGEFLPIPSHYIGADLWRKHINALAQHGKDDFLGTVFNEKKLPTECPACKTHHIVVVMVAP